MTMISRIVLLVLLTSSPTFALDVWDFHSGMSEAEATAQAMRQGFPVSSVLFNATKRFRSISYREGVTVGYIASFCDGRLTSISHEYKVNGIGTVFDLLSELKDTYGVPRAETSSTMLTEGRVRVIRYRFSPKPDDVVSINVVLNSDGTGFTVTVDHDNTQMVCR